MAMPKTQWFDNAAVLRIILTVVLAGNTALVMWFLAGNQTLSAFVRLSSSDSTSDLPGLLPSTKLSTEPSGDKIAMLIETRMSGNLAPLMLHFSEVLGPSWQVVLFTMEEMWTMPSSVQFQNAVQTDRIRIQFLPPDAIVTQWIWVNYFLTRPWIWQQVESASRVLLFQMDSIICSNSNMTVDNFLEWDYIGAPIPSAWGEGYNGGLSLRNPKMILDILASPSNDFDAKWDPGHFKSYTEDQWYYTKMKELPHAKLPDRDVAKRFSVEQEWYDRPVGYHAPRLYNRKRMQEIWEYCPEVELVNRDNKRLPGDNDDPKQK